MKDEALWLGTLALATTWVLEACSEPPACSTSTGALLAAGLGHGWKVSVRMKETSQNLPLIQQSAQHPSPLGAHP